MPPPDGRDASQDDAAGHEPAAPTPTGRLHRPAGRLRRLLARLERALIDRMES